MTHPETLPAASVSDRGEESRSPQREPGPFARQVASLLWIFVAWAAGTVVFELTAMGGEKDYVKIESGDDGFLGLFESHRPLDPVETESDDGGK